MALYLVVSNLSSELLELFGGLGELVYILEIITYLVFKRISKGHVIGFGYGVDLRLEVPDGL